MVNTVNASWETEQSTLIVLYQDDRAERLNWAICRAREWRGQPLQLKKRLGNWLTLLGHIQDRPDLHAAALELIALLHQPVINLGYLTEWTPQVYFAIAVCRRLGLMTEQAEFLERLSNILYWTGQFEAAQAAAEESLAIGRITGDPRILVVGAKGAIGALIARAQSDAARALLQSIKTDPLVQGATGPVQAWIMAQLLIYEAMVRRLIGGPNALIASAELSDQAMEWLARYPEVDPNLYAHFCRNQGVYHWTIDHYDRAVQLLQRAIDLFRQQDDPFDRRLTEGTLALAYWSTGQLLEAENLAQQSARAAKRVNGRWQFTRHIGTLALIALYRGRLREARRYAERHCQLAEQLGVAMEYSRARCNRGIIALHQGDYETALVDMDFDRCYLEQRHPSSEGLVPTYVNLARGYASLSNLTDAHVCVNKALAIAETTGLASLRLITLRALAECFPPDDRESPIGPLREALTLAESTGRPIDIAGCLFSLAHLTNDTRLWERGVTLLCRMHATAWLNNGSGECTIDRVPRLPAVT